MENFFLAGKAIGVDDSKQCCQQRRGHELYEPAVPASSIFDHAAASMTFAPAKRVLALSALYLYLYRFFRLASRLRTSNVSTKNNDLRFFDPHFFFLLHEYAFHGDVARGHNESTMAIADAVILAHCTPLAHLERFVAQQSVRML